MNKFYRKGYKGEVPVTPVIRRCQKLVDGSRMEWGWAVTRGWWTAWGQNVREAWAAWEKLTKA